MCGIAGFVVPENQLADETQLKRMLDVIVHRGPDDDGTYVRGNVALGMRRLSIIDLGTGHQPIHNEKRDVWVVFNGEIYNYQSLRQSLEALGHQFYTQSDTEVIVHLYEEHGERFVEHLNGMFGIALWDERAKRLVIARDRLGEKQIYYARRNGALAFGSEIKCLLQTNLVSRDMNLRAIDGFLNFLYTPAPETAFNDVHELPPAHVLILDAAGLRVQRYWNVRFGVREQKSEREWIDVFRRQFAASVRSRLVSDVPLGALLSGGIDSSAVVAEMAAAANGRVKTFCIGYGADGAYYDERRYAAMVARKFDTEHVELVVTPDVVKIIPQLVEAFDQPFADSSAIANYYVFRETRKHVKVVLTGLGGDEVAAGYERYLGLQLHRRYRALPSWLREQVIERIAGLLPDPKSGNRTVERVKRFVRQGSLPDDRAYLGYISAFDDARRGELWTKSARAGLADCNPALFITQPFNQSGASDALSSALYADTMTYLSGDLLTLTDRMSMQSSIEARAPLIDHELVELMARVPSSLKLRGFTKKYLLKKAFEGTLPHEILYRKKRGFTVPLTVWFRNELKPLLQRELSRERIEHVGLFNWQYVQRLVEEHATNRENHHSRLWALLMFMVWHERYIER
jgi:asparagine synthase (glutamine-hydrolysing)